MYLTLCSCIVVLVRFGVYSLDYVFSKFLSNMSFINFRGRWLDEGASDNATNQKAARLDIVARWSKLMVH
jgi:hypothetical protein